jgi:hypothetical protein
MFDVANRFLTALDPTAKKFLFVTFDDVPGRRNNALLNTFYGSLATYYSKLEYLNRQGAGIYVTINKTKANRRKKGDIIEARALWQEDDSGIVPKLAADHPPSIIVNTSKNHAHRYWLIHPSEDLAAWERAQEAMCRTQHSDPGAKDLARVLRLPGFYNNKRAAPELVELVSVDDRMYHLADLCTELGVAPPTEFIEEESIPGTGAEGGIDQQSMLLEYYAQIQRGEHLHTPIRALMMIFANQGQDITMNKLQCQIAIGAWPHNDERKQKALDDLDSMLAATYRKIEQEEHEEYIPLSEIRGSLLDEQPQVEPDWPPGMMGDLARAANEFFVVPNKTVAIMTALSLVAGIVGRRYNVSRSGLNLYSTIMMPTGAGKDSIRKFCQRVLMDKTMLGTNGLAFLGPQNFTGPAALLKTLVRQPSMLCVMTEAGLLYKSDSGDKNGLTRVILQAYTSSGANEFIETEKYTQDRDDIPAVRAPALTIINEATPITLLGELKKRESINTGEIPRMWIFMLDGRKPYNNPNPHDLHLPSEVSRRIKDLLIDCYNVQNDQHPQVVNIAPPLEYIDFTIECTDRYNQLIAEDPNRAIMYTRAAHKVLKVASIIEVFNNPSATVPDGRAWEWARSLFEVEMQHVHKIIGYVEPMDKATEDAFRIILNLLEGVYKGQNKYIDPKLREKNIFTESPFRQAAASTASIRDCGISPKYGSPKSGARIVLEYLQAEGYIRKVKLRLMDGRGKNTSVQYQLTPQGQDMAKQLFNNAIVV